jgi:hypothetical protein
MEWSVRRFVSQWVIKPQKWVGSGTCMSCGTDCETLMPLRLIVNESEGHRLIYYCKSIKSLKLNLANESVTHIALASYLCMALSMCFRHVTLYCCVGHVTPHVG